jgi:hypothetical protein
VGAGKDSFRSFHHSQEVFQKIFSAAAQPQSSPGKVTAWARRFFANLGSDAGLFLVLPVWDHKSLMSFRGFLEAAP